MAGPPDTTKPSERKKLAGFIFRPTIDSGTVMWATPTPVKGTELADGC